MTPVAAEAGIRVDLLSHPLYVYPTNMSQIARSPTESSHFKDVAFVHLDMNCAWPEQRALEFFSGRLSKGGIILFDDYTYIGHEAQRAAIQETASKPNFKVLSLPTGQGLIVK
jgi:hypothetical protein